MNSVQLIGRLTKDAELKSTQSGLSVCSFSLAVERPFKNANGEREADFINCVAWRQTAEFISRYFKKGTRIAVAGSLQVRSWDDNGNKRYVTEVIAEKVFFADGKQESSTKSNNSNITSEYLEDETTLPFDL